MRILTSLILLSFMSWPLMSAASGGHGGGLDMSGAPSSSERKPKSPEAIANAQYRAGVKAKEKAWKLEEKAAKASSDARREKTLAKAREQYEKAREALGGALQVNNQHYEAASELGYVLRKLGDYKKSIGAYNFALQLKPDYYPAIEYRGEAFLAMGYVEEAKQAYMTLFRNERALAAELMTAMEIWLAQQPEDSARAEFDAWLSERRELARAGADLSMNNTRSW
ncbi:MAG: hypothetical protein H6994_18555 [Pseudomonadales bacterium]|nr:hypothetical protein [Pseudomonadales bacterium]